MLLTHMFVFSSWSWSPTIVLPSSGTATFPERRNLKYFLLSCYLDFFSPCILLGLVTTINTSTTTTFMTQTSSNIIAFRCVSSNKPNNYTLTYIDLLLSLLFIVRIHIALAFTTNLLTISTSYVTYLEEHYSISNCRVGFLLPLYLATLSRTNNTGHWAGR